jgi:hypothetical protein
MNDVEMVTGNLKFYFESLVCAKLVYQLYDIQKLNMLLYTYSHTHMHMHTQSMCVCVCVCALEHMYYFCTEIISIVRIKNKCTEKILWTYQMHKDTEIM